MTTLAQGPGQLDIYWPTNADLNVTFTFTANSVAYDVGTASIVLYKSGTTTVATGGVLTPGQPQTGTVTLAATASVLQALVLNGALKYTLVGTKAGVPYDLVAGQLLLKDPTDTSYTPTSSAQSVTVNTGTQTVSVAVAVAANSAANITYTPTITNQATNAQTAITNARSIILPQVNQAYAAGTNNRAAGQAGSYNVIGFDSVNTIGGVPAPYCQDAGNGLLRLCLTFDANGAPATWSTGKTLPTGTQWFNTIRVLTFKGNLYLLTVEDASSLPAVYQATPTSGSSALVWTKVLTGTAGSGTILSRPTCIAADANFIYYADYGDPTGGPQVYRSSDGTTWNSVATFAGIRHVHAIAPDPNNLGTVWIAMGDGVTNPNRYSTDFGATWTALPLQNGSAVQCTDISFTSTDAWLCDDTSYVTAVVVDKATKTWKVGSAGFHGNLAVPGKYNVATWDPPSIATGASTSTTVTVTGARVGHAAIASFSLAVPAGASMTAAVTANDTVTVTLTNNTGSALDLLSGTVRAGITGGTFAPAVFYGQVDPATEVFYCVTQQQFQTPDVGLFAVFGKGAAPVLLDWGPFGNYGVFISGGRVYYGNVNRPLLKVSATT